MFFVPVDLFGSYLNGVRQANADNWNDLNQYNTVENGIMRNNLFADTYNDQLAQSNATGRIAQNRATGSDLDTQNAIVGQPGRLAQTGATSRYQQQFASDVIPQLPQISQNNVATLLGNSNLRRQQTAAQERYQPDLWNLQGQGAVAQQRASNDLIPLQTEATKSGLTASNSYNQYLTSNPNVLSGNNTTTQQPQTGSLTLNEQLYQQGLGIPPNQIHDVTISGQAYKVGRDSNGLIFVVNTDGSKTYVQPNGNAGATGNVFSWGG